MSACIVFLYTVCYMYHVNYQRKHLALVHLIIFKQFLNILFVLITVLHAWPIALISTSV